MASLVGRLPSQVWHPPLDPGRVVGHLHGGRWCHLQRHRRTTRKTTTDGDDRPIERFHLRFDKPDDRNFIDERVV
uniref:Uncharacterized protein n=1 Tax=Panagrolaimus sp. JU765 TaxID=591449 RepID=A0AC34QQI9_9BILA